MSWSDVRGHDDAWQQLLTAHRRGRLGHAYLFVGPEGVGKSRFAIEFTKALLCESPPGVLTACDSCAACAQVAADTHPDFARFARPEDKLEFVVEVAQQVVENLSLRPARGRGRVCLLDDADTLNEESANCLLKSLEEPPTGSVLILIGTAIELQLPTILSRCQVIRFRPLSTSDLRLVLIDQGVTDPADIDRLVRLSGGAVGRALALADKAVAEYYESLLGAFTVARPDSFSIGKRMVEFVTAAGKDGGPKRARASLVVRMVLDLLRQSLLTSLGGTVPQVGRIEHDAISRWAALGPDCIADALEACTEADRGIDRRVQLEVLLEQLADRLCRRS